MEVIRLTRIGAAITDLIQSCASITRYCIRAHFFDESTLGFRERLAAHDKLCSGQRVSVRLRRPTDPNRIARSGPQAARRPGLFLLDDPINDAANFVTIKKFGPRATGSEQLCG